MWKPIKGYEGLYQINNKGEIKSLARKVNTLTGDIRTTEERIIKPTKVKTKKGTKEFVILYSYGKRKRFYVKDLIKQYEEN